MRGAEEMALSVTGMALCTCGIIYAAVLLSFNVKFRNLRFIKMTSPRVNFCMIFGCCLLYASSLLLAALPASESLSQRESAHQLMYWFVTFGFTMTYGSMLVKGWRVNRLFQYPRQQTVSIKDGNLFCGILLLALLDIGFLTVWQVVDPITCDGDVATASIQCTCNHYAIWMMVLLIYKFILVILCCFVGWAIRHVTFPSLDDGRCLLLSSGVTLVATSSITTLVSLQSHQLSAIYFTASVIVWFGTTIVLSSAFVPKMVIVYRANGREPLLSSAAKYFQQPVSSDVGQELIKILGENRYLKRKLDERETLVTHLRRQLSTSVNMELTSQPTSSTDYSVAASDTSRSQFGRSGCSLKHVMLLCCGSEPPYDVKKVISTSVESPPPSLKTDIVIPTPIPEECHSYNCVTETVDEMAPPSIHSKCGSEVSSLTVPNQYRLARSPRVFQCDSDTHSVTIPASPTKVNAANTWAYGALNKDMDLICSIADTYNMPDDSDTYSYISNCLYHTRSLGGSMTLSREKDDKPKRQRRSTLHHSAALGSDQLYPESSRSARHTKCKRQSKAPKRPPRRRRSTVGLSTNGTSGNTVFTNELGNTLII